MKFKEIVCFAVVSGLSKTAYCKNMVNGFKQLRGRQLKDVPAQNIFIYLYNQQIKSQDELIVPLDGPEAL